jgi:UDP-N-acetylmuramate-alanine ligase
MKARNELRIVKEWVRDMLYVKHVNFHPDTAIANYVTPEGAAAFPESKRLQRQLDRFFLVCQKYGTDIYQFSLPIFRAYLKTELNLSR